MNDFESTTPSEHQVAERYTDVLVDYLTVSFRGVIISEHLHRTDDLDARSVRRYEYDTLLVVLVLVVGIALAHNKVNLATRVSSTADPPTQLVKLLLFSEGRKGHTTCDR